jgi:sulfite exporter TauE/SafE
VLILALAIHSSHLGTFAAVVAFGFLVGVIGHIIRSRTLILTGILVIGLASAYYTLVLEPAK